MTRMKAKTFGVIKSSRYHSIAKPSPLGAPISSAATIAVQAEAKASRNPTMMLGSAAGVTTLRRITARPTPMVRAAATSFGSTAFTPATVLSRS